MSLNSDVISKITDTADTLFAQSLASKDWYLHVLNGRDNLKLDDVVLADIGRDFSFEEAKDLLLAQTVLYSQAFVHGNHETLAKLFAKSKEKRPIENIVAFGSTIRHPNAGRMIAAANGRLTLQPVSRTFSSDYRLLLIPV